MLWPVADHMRLKLWFGAIVVTVLARTLIVLSYRRKVPSDVEHLRWERLCIWPRCLSGAIWGIGGMLLMSTEPLAYQVIVYLFLIGITSGSAGLYSVQTSVKTFALVLFMLPATLWLFCQDGSVHVALAFSGSIFLLMTIYGVSVQGKLLRQSFLLAYELQEAKMAAEHLARTDTLTGLNNRRAFAARGVEMLKLARSQSYPVSAIMLDIDHFKKINDTHGHAAGDTALQHVASLLMQHLRKSDVCGRIGGEEFAILLPGTSPQDAMNVAEGLRRLIAESSIVFSNKTIAVTSSFGVAAGSEDMELLLRMADVALYCAKNDGRNRVVCHGQHHALESRTSVHT